MTSQHPGARGKNQVLTWATVILIFILPEDHEADQMHGLSVLTQSDFIQKYKTAWETMLIVLLLLFYSLSLFILPPGPQTAQFIPLFCSLGTIIDPPWIVFTAAESPLLMQILCSFIQFIRG